MKVLRNSKSRPTWQSRYSYSSLCVLSPSPQPSWLGRGGRPFERGNWTGLDAGAPINTYRDHEYVIITILTTSHTCYMPEIPLIEGRFREAILKAEREVASRGGS